MDALATAGRRLRTPLGSALALAILLVVGAPPLTARADVDDFRFDSFDATMTLTRAEDGHAELAVTETLVARFPDDDQNRGIVRALPNDYDGVPLQTQVVSVTDGDGDAVPFEVESDRDEVRVLIGDDRFVRGVQTYVITYTQRDTIRAFADTDADEFYRDINGTQWEQPFGRVSVELAVDPAIATATLEGASACYVGEEGSRDRCEIARTAAPDGGATFAASSTDLAPGENVTIAVGFAPGTFVPGTVVRTPTEQFSVDAAPVLSAVSLGTVGLGVAAIGAALVARRRTRDAAGRGVIVAEYAPPSDVDVVEGAQLVNRASAAVPAAVLDTAIAGHLRLIEDPDSDDGIALEFVDRAGATPLRAGVLAAVFGDTPSPGDRVVLGADRNDVATELQQLPTVAAAELRRRGWLEKPPPGPSVLAGGIAVAAFVLSVVALIVTSIGQPPPWWQIAAIPVSAMLGILVFLLLRYRDRVTDAGAPARDHLRGLREYLTLAEADRLRVLQSPEGAERRRVDATDDVLVLHLYERLLPWAIVWGVERDWAEVLDTRLRETGGDLDWYRGPGGFSTVSFASTLATIHAGSTPAPATASGAGSFSGGSFGGGFSGGGMGGGGGGGR